MLRLTRLPLLVVAAALVLPAAASAADCQLQAPHAAVEHPIAGTGLVARDPYGGLLPRNRLFFDFSVRGDATGVAKVTWAMDGKVVREDPRAPYEWKGLSGSSTRMPVGDHTITVTVVPTSGTTASTDFALTATDCQPATFNAEVAKLRGPASLVWASAFESSGEPLTGVAATATKNVTASLPTSLRGRAIGTLQIGSKSYTLKGAKTALSRGKLKVSFAPGAKQFLKVSGLPAKAQRVTIKLKPGLLSLRAPTKSYRLSGSLTAASGTVSGLLTGGTYV
ncbi:MAG TPA: hypothetical protein VFY45_25255 [Baekduia sp.]|nr:hypothetical protein [Baekduia sp.]